MNIQSISVVGGVVVVVITLFGFLWTIQQGVADVKNDIVAVHQDFATVHRDMGSLRERLARIEVFVEIFTQRDLEPSATLASTTASLDGTSPTNCKGNGNKTIE